MDFKKMTIAIMIFIAVIALSNIIFGVNFSLIQLVEGIAVGWIGSMAYKRY